MTVVDNIKQQQILWPRHAHENVDKMINLEFGDYQNDQYNEGRETDQNLMGMTDRRNPREYKKGKSQAIITIGHVTYMYTED